MYLLLFLRALLNTELVPVLPNILAELIGNEEQEEYVKGDFYIDFDDLFQVNMKEQKKYYRLQHIGNDLRFDDETCDHFPPKAHPDVPQTTLSESILFLLFQVQSEDLDKRGQEVSVQRTDIYQSAEKLVFDALH